MEPKIHQLHQPLPSMNRQKPTSPKAETSFQHVLNEVQELKVSKHAKERLQERKIEIGEAKWREISNKMSEAKRKGVTDSLVITDQATLVVSTKNNTVVTAMGREEASSKIFTNINGTIVLED
ncbi:TIGR02530 family flagellar biosynthesis protein [Halobacillus sp. BBL2006]|uniref:TIGR02530 family flagellar biosynthesis protein n=1 Tax=Halobacillus sp. BBL2006 TaxID=1543706 RepID=UPI000542554C|nr:TIGR02530 family flagellar biosynthesis protein [Halobacillus sp. BBL2006]KHE73292.1 flagellar protein [Halobacillus sp. BBL2006]